MLESQSEPGPRGVTHRPGQVEPALAAVGGRDSPSRVRRGLRRIGRFLAEERLLTQCLSIVILLVLWQIVGSLLNPIFLSTPEAVAEELYALTSSGVLLEGAAETTGTFLAAFGLAIVLGVPFGLATGAYKVVRNFADVWVRILYVIPSIALIPVFTAWFGIGTTLKLVVAFHAAFFVMVINTDAGVKATSEVLTDVAKSFGASQRQTFLTVIFPSSVPFIAAGLRVGLSRAILGTLVAEMFASVGGLGYLLLLYGGSFSTARVFAVLIVLALISLICSALIERFERVFSHWR